MQSGGFSSPETFSVDPSVALMPTAIPIFDQLAFFPKLEYVIEIVGPRTISASLAKALLRIDWQQALAQPKVVAMAQSDRSWIVLRDDNPNNSFDSLALCWNLTSKQGTLSNSSAQHLLTVSESFANQVQRRAIPHLPPQDIEQRIADISSVSSEYDFGIGLTLVPRTGAIEEGEIWKVAANLGLDLDPSGIFTYRVAGWEQPLIELSSLSESDVFSLASMKARTEHPALSVGFRVPVNPVPDTSLDYVFQVARTFRQRLFMNVLDDDGNTVDDRREQEIRGALKAALEALKRAGLVPGSPQSLLIFT